MYHYRKSNLRGVSHLVGVLLASCIPAASIFTLYYVNRMVDRLGVIVVYSAIFSVCLALFTTARRVEIFGATAAYVSFLSASVMFGFFTASPEIFDRFILNDLPFSAFSSFLVISELTIPHHYSFASVQVVFVGSTTGTIG